MRESEDLLNEVQEKIIKACATMIQSAWWAIFWVDLLMLWVAKRSMLLISWFLMLMKNKNFLSAASLVRLHLDSLLQIYWAYMVDSPEEYAVHKIKWWETRDYQDKKWNKMTDAYIRKCFFADPNNSEFLPLENVYSETSWFVHFSDKHIYMLFSKREKRNFELSMWPTMEVNWEEETQIMLCMITITYGILEYTEWWIRRKNSYPTT